MRAKRRRLLRNASIAAANLGAENLLDELVRLSADKDTIIAVHARWAVEQLRRR
jgi:epoxyqueuosine reductase QueG